MEDISQLKQKRKNMIETDLILDRCMILIYIQRDVFYTILFQHIGLISGKPLLVFSSFMNPKNNIPYV